MRFQLPSARSRGKVLRCAPAILTFFLISTGAASQQADLASFREAIDVRVINLEVVVTDRAGDRVTDLRPEDFRLIVDAEEVAIEYFSEIRQRQAISPPPAAEEPTRDPAHRATPQAPAPAPAAETGAAVATNFLVFVDNFFGIARDRDRILRKLQEDLPLLRPNDRFAIVAFDGRELELIGPWSSSPEEVTEHLRRAMEQPAFGLQRCGEQNRYDAQYELGQGWGPRGESEIGADADLTVAGRGQTTAYAVDRVRFLSRQIRTVVVAATSALRTFASLPGRKVMLLMSGGWPRDPTLSTAGMDAQVREASRRYSSMNSFEELIDTANLLGYTLYPIDMPGLQIRNAGAAERSGWEADMATIAKQPANQPVSRIVETQEIRKLVTSAIFAESSFAASAADFDRTVGREHENEASLMVMAEKTGGLAMLNGFREVALDETVRDVSSYYWLGFSPQRQRDDEQHAIRVEILRPGLEARSRQGFSDFSRKSAATMMVESQLLFSTDLGAQALGVELGTPSRRRRGELQVPVSLRIPLDGVVMLPVAEGYQARLELRVAAIDDRGNRSDIPVVPFQLEGATPPPPGAHAVYDAELALRPHTRRLVVAVHDVQGEAILTASVDLESEPDAKRR